MKTKLLSWLLTLSLLMTMLPTAAFAADGASENTYEVSTADDLSTVLTEIAESTENEATIVLKADVAAPGFGGIAGKKVTITSSDGNCYSISMANTLTGDVTLDAVKFGGGLIYANGHTFETTGNFQGYSGSATLYGGGPKGQDVDGDTHLILRGKASYNWVYGGGCNSNVSGSTYILVDDKNTSTGNLTGGGESNNTDPTAAPVGTVGGDTHVTIQKGYSGYLVGGGRNHGDQSLKENARVYGDTYVTAGEADATELQAWIGTAMASVAGSFSSTVKNTHFLVLNGVCSYKSDDDIAHELGTGEIYGAGMLDIVRGTTNVEVRADNAVGSRIVDVYGGHYADATTLTGEVSIRNEDNEPYAVHIIYDNVPENEYIYEPNHECDIYALGKVTPTIPVNGNVLVEVKHGNLRQVVLDSYDNDCTINGDATVRITGGRVARLEGNRAHATTGTKNTAIYDGCGTTAAPQETGYLYNFEQVTLKNGAQVSIDADPTLFPALSTVQNPFYSVNNLDITENSALTTRKSNTLIKKNVTMDHGTWHAKGFLWVYEQTKSKDSRLYFDNFFVLAQNHKSDSDPTLYTAWDSQNDELVALKSGYSGRIYGNANLNRSDVTFLCPTTVSGNWTSSNSILRLPTVATGANYPTVLIPLEIGGLSTGTTTVNTVDPADWQTLKKPALGDNYILSMKNTDSPAQGVFVLGNADAVGDGWFLKRMADADGTDDYYMWQVANGVRVIFDKNGGDTEASPRIMSQEKVAGRANHFDLPTTNPTRTGYLFNGWNTKADGAGAVFTAETDVTDNMTVYAQWKPDEAYAVKIAPMNLTVYVGGDGYHGVIGQDGKFAANDLPEIGFYITLPDDINTMLGGTDEKPVDLSDKLRLTPVDDNGTMRSWSLELYSDESKSHVMENGRRVYVYKLRQIDDGEETVPRVQFTRADGSVMTESKFQALLTDQFRNYKISVYQGLLDEQIYKATFTTTDGKTFTRPIKLGTGTLKVRGNNDTTYRAIENNTIPRVNPQEKDIMLVSTAQTGTQYYINNSGISVPSSDDVKLMVDHSLDDALLSAYINRTSNTEGKYSYQFRYLDLVDTSNGNTYVTMGAGQKMNLYWPVPSDAKSNSEFHIIHFKGIDRDSDADVNDLLTTRIPENLTCEKVTIDGQQFIKFTTDSFSPFALLYEKAASSGGSSSGGGSSSSSKYTLHYESNGGTSYKDESYSSGTTVTLDKAPTRESYTFTGWYADKALTDKITNVKMTGNKTVYAGWEATGVPDMLNGDDHYAYVVGYSDGTVRPNANISRAEVATIFFRLLKEEVRDGNLTTENIFADVTDGQWHNKAISTMAKLGIVKGRRADRFDPDASITRAEFAAICARFNTKPVENSGSFSDISGHWAENKIERAAAFGWISGYPDGTFHPDARITRAEAMTMINRVLCRMPQSESDLLDSMVTWPDNKPSDWHYLAVQEATNSHDFNRQGEVGESWTKLTSVPDWKQYQ